ncbi:hypothetical protein L1887_54131 [Cichorium endivia]|nr:hypothetical protein L1887_54131 [Cichorium endivia]
MEGDEPDLRTLRSMWPEVTAGTRHRRGSWKTRGAAVDAQGGVQRVERVLQTAHDSETSGRHKRGEAREPEQRDWQEADKMKAATEGAEADTMRNRTSNGETASCGRTRQAHDPCAHARGDGTGPGELYRSGKSAGP